jgi:hypothetical protein
LVKSRPQQYELKIGDLTAARLTGTFVDRLAALTKDCS